MIGGPDGPDAGDRPGPAAAAAVAAPRLVEHYFRHEYGRLVALLTRKAGVRHLESVEDAVQGALLAALTAWTDRGLPDDPGAWLYRVACNNLIGDLRRKTDRLRILEQAVHPAIHPAIHPATGSVEDPPAPYFASEVQDDMLRMLFICCADAIPRDSRLVLALKTLCGFSTAEIALRLFTSEANVHKRLARARDRLREAPPNFETPPLDTLKGRLPSVTAVLYLLFNEGYLSAHAEHAIRRELCDEAIRLTTLLAEHAVGAVPETFALLALMHLHAARLEARCDGMGGLLLLEEQDRSLWDREQMRLGAEWLRRSADGDVFSRFHAEAGIAAEHCFAPSFGLTRWSEIADLYAMLERIDPSPAAHLEPRGRRRGVARTGGWTRVAARARAARVARGLVPLGRRHGRSSSARGPSGDRAATRRAGAGFRADGSGTPAAPEKTRRGTEVQPRHSFVESSDAIRQAPPRCAAGSIATVNFVSRSHLCARLVRKRGW